MANLVSSPTGLTPLFTYVDRASMVWETLHTIVLPFSFKFNGVEYGNGSNGGVTFCSAGYINFGTPYVDGNWAGYDYGAWSFKGNTNYYPLVHNALLFNAEEISQKIVAGGVVNGGYRIYLEGWSSYPTDWANVPPTDLVYEITFNTDNSIVIKTDTATGMVAGVSGVVKSDTFSAQETIHFDGTVVLTTADNGVTWTSTVTPKPYPDIEKVNRNYLIGEKVVGNNVKAITTSAIDEYQTTLVVGDSTSFEQFFTNSDLQNQVQIATITNAAKTVFETVHIQANDTATNTLTIRRGREGTTPSAFGVGSTIFSGVTAALLDSAGKRLLTSGNFFIDKSRGALPSQWRDGADVSLTIGVGGDFPSLGACARFLNNSNIQSWYQIYIHFLQAGVYVESESLDVLFSNKESMPNITITGRAVNSKWYDNPTSVNVTAVTDVNTTSKTMTLTVSDTSSFYIGGLFAIAPPTGSVPAGLTVKFSLMGAQKITAINSSTSVTVSYAYNSAVGNPTVVSGLTGISGYCARVTIANSYFMVSGRLGNSFYNGGGFDKISFDNCHINVDGGYLMFNDYVSLNNTSIKLDNNGYLKTWGSITYTSCHPIVNNSTYDGDSQHYLNSSSFNVENSKLYIRSYLQENDISTVISNTKVGCVSYLSQLKTGTNTGTLTVPTQTANNYLGYSRT